MFLDELFLHSVHPPPFLQEGGGGGEPSTKFSKRVSLIGPQLFRGGFAGKEGVTFFQRGCNCHIKNKLKSEIFNDKKIYKQQCFSLS